MPCPASSTLRTAPIRPPATLVRFPPFQILPRQSGVPATDRLPQGRSRSGGASGGLHRSFGSLPEGPSSAGDISGPSQTHTTSRLQPPAAVVPIGCQHPPNVRLTAVTASDALATPAAPAPKADSLEVIRKFAETYAQRTGTYFCSDPGVTAVVLEGLARNKDELGGALCPCRHYEDKQAEVAQAFWNCPCVPMRERKECHCMLFLTEDNPFRGEQQTISLEEVRALTAG